MPMAAIYCNPSTAGLSPNETLALLRWVTATADDNPVGMLATKVDLEGHHKEIDARIYMPHVKGENEKKEGTNYHGAVNGSTRVKTYDKGGESGGELHQVARFEITQKLKNNGNPKKNLRRPTTLAMLRGDWVESNAFRRAMVVDLDAVGDPALTQWALEDGLIEALCKGHLPSTGNRGANMGWLRRRVHDNADKEMLFNLYREQALPWHAQLDVEAVDNLTVVWNDDLGLEIVPRAAATTTITAA